MTSRPAVSDGQAPRGAGQAAGSPALGQVEPAPVAVRPPRPRWRTGSLGKVAPANAVDDLALLARVRDRLRELPDVVAEPASPEPAATSADPAVDAMREAFDAMAGAGEMAAAYFYGWLFVRNPELRDLFPAAMDEQRERLFRALARIVRGVGSQELGGYLAQLGRDHRKFAVTPQMYPAMGEALIATLRAFAGPAFTPLAQAAWASAFHSVSAQMIEAAEADSAVSPAFWTAEVTDHRQPHRDIAMLTVTPDQLLPYQPGQHVAVQTARWPKVWRPYSVACRPRPDGLLRFHVKAVPGGWVSTALVRYTSPGDKLTLGPARGGMTLADDARDLLCVAGGTGLAPVLAIIEQVVHADAQLREHRKIRLFWGARTEAELYDLPGLWRLTDGYPWLQVYPVISEDPGYPGMRGTVGQVAARHLPQWDHDVYVAGPPAMLRETVEELTKAGVPPARIHHDDDAALGDPPGPAPPGLAPPAG